MRLISYPAQRVRSWCGSPSLLHLILVPSEAEEVCGARCTTACHDETVGRPVGDEAFITALEVTTNHAQARQARAEAHVESMAPSAKYCRSMFRAHQEAVAG